MAKQNLQGSSVIQVPAVDKSRNVADAYGSE